MRFRLILIVILMGTGSFACPLALMAANSTKASAHLSLAEDYLTKRDYVMAAMHATAAIRMDPGNLYFYHVRGLAQARMKLYPNAIRDFTHVLKKEPKRFPKTYYFRGDCLVAIGLVELALRDYTQCLRLRPKDGKVWYLRARTLALIGAKDKALLDIQRGISTGYHVGWLQQLQKAILQGGKLPEWEPCSN